jgi:3-oxoacyl-[acyl-carrier protein] reductase
MDLGLKGRVAIVCAASQGLGKATAEGFAHEGTHVVICARDRKRIFTAAKQISASVRGSSVTIVPVVADLTRAKDIRKLVALAVREFDRVDILVTNAGGPPAGMFPDLSDTQWETGITLNLMSTIRCIREVLPQMQKRKWGRIINITSLTVKQPVNDLIISSTVRPGILGLSKILANEYGKDGITVNNVAPGYIMTARQEELSTVRAAKKGMSVEQFIRELSKDVPVRRYGTPSELANVIVFLASEKASYVNGTTLSVDGGLVKGLF